MAAKNDKEMLLNVCKDLRPTDIKSLAFLLGINDIDGDEVFRLITYFQSRPTTKTLLEDLEEDLRTINRIDLVRKIRKHRGVLENPNKMLSQRDRSSSMSKVITQRPQNLQNNRSESFDVGPTFAISSSVVMANETSTQDIETSSVINSDRHMAASQNNTSLSAKNEKLKDSKTNSMEKEEVTSSLISKNQKENLKKPMAFSNNDVEQNLSSNFKRLKLDDSSQCQSNIPSNILIPIEPSSPDEFEYEDTDEKKGVESEYNDAFEVIGMEANAATDTIPEHVSQEIKVEQYSDDSDDDDDDEYEMNGNPCGKCIIFNNTFAHPVPMENEQRILSHREGTDVDVRRLKSLFQWLKFKVVVHTDEDKEGIEDILKKESSNSEHNIMNCLVVCILSHGKEGGIFTADGKFIKFQEILDMFSCDQVTPLFGKPKLFFVQACQGEMDGKYVEFDSLREPSEDYDSSTEGDDKKSRKVLNVKADQFVFLSTTPGQTSWRSRQKGSWFIQTFCTVFEKFAHKMPFNELILKVNRKISQRAERVDDDNVASMMSTVGQNTLRKIIRFRPDGKFSSSTSAVEDADR